MVSLIIALGCQHLHADDSDILDELQDTNAFIQEETQIPERQPTPDEIVPRLILINAQQILQEQLFCRTNRLNTRSLLDLSVFLQQKVDTYNYCRVFGAHLFWNQTSRMNFNEDNTNICSFLGITNPNLLEKIQDSVTIIQQVFPAFNIDPINILLLFKNATIQQRRIGFMFHGQKDYGRANFRFYFPVYYLEHNFFLTKAEQKAIEAELGTNESQDEFADNHLIADEIGLGDTRFYLDFYLCGCGKEDFGIRLGALATIPTAFPFKKGLKGSYFPTCPTQPTFDFGALFDQANKEMTDKVMQKFLFQVLDHLSANLIQRPLGNGGHVGLGGLMKSQTPLHIFIKRPWTEKIIMKSFLSLEYLLPAEEKRFYVEKNTVDAFNALGLNKSNDDILNRIAEDPAYAQAVLTLLQDQFVDTLYPFVFKTRVHPGFIFRWCTRFFYEGKKWGADIGSDLWVSGPEKLCNIQKNDPTLNLDIAKARKPVAWQSKVIGSIFYTAKRKCRDWIFSLNGDYTISSSGIGKDFTVTLNVETNF